MSIGPMEMVAFSFPGNQFTGEIGSALGELVASGTIRILDLAILSKDATGMLTAMQIADLDPWGAASTLALVTGEEGYFADEDYLAFGETMAPNSTEALMLFENTWATKFASAVRNAGGELVLSERIPRAVAEELILGV